MRKPAHATNPTVMEVTVFEKNDRKAAFSATGADPSHIAKTVSEHRVINPHERQNVRRKVRTALQGLSKRTIPNMTNLTLDIGGRRIRVKEI